MMFSNRIFVWMLPLLMAFSISLRASGTGEIETYEDLAAFAEASESITTQLIAAMTQQADTAKLLNDLIQTRAIAERDMTVEEKERAMENPSAAQQSAGLVSSQNDELLQRVQDLKEELDEIRPAIQSLLSDRDSYGPVVSDLIDRLATSIDDYDQWESKAIQFFQKRNGATSPLNLELDTSRDPMLIAQLQSERQNLQREMLDLADRQKLGMQEILAALSSDGINLDVPLSVPQLEPQSYLSAIGRIVDRATHICRMALKRKNL